MLHDLDPHSSYINTSEWKQFRRQIEGRFGGIGIQVGMDPKMHRLKVIAPMVGTPAYEAGVLAGDLIMEIDGHTTEGMNPGQGRRGSDRSAGHQPQAQRPPRRGAEGGDPVDEPGDHRRSQRPGRQAEA